MGKKDRARNRKERDEEKQSGEAPSAERSDAPVAETSSKPDGPAPVFTVRNKQKNLLVASRGTSHRYRHLLEDFLKLMPHAVKDSKVEQNIDPSEINEVAELRACNNSIFFETRKRVDFYLWAARVPTGPTMKFHVLNIHTMDELKLTGNCLKGSRPLLIFDGSFDEEPHLAVAKELLSQMFGTPKGHKRSKPFFDHCLCFYYLDHKIWFRNYQISDITASGKKGETVLTEIGPRFVLDPIVVLEGSFSGKKLFENAHYVSPNVVRASIRKRKAGNYTGRLDQKDKRTKYLSEHPIPQAELEDVFED
mmetsp:Transcript_39474/g.101286  ORF Transcript_39474/g.101286 Transcript_39474/m.101286 type:complete len:307 (-) Transcript_39474:2628-3548(-)